MVKIPDAPLATASVFQRLEELAAETATKPSKELGDEIMRAARRGFRRAGLKEVKRMPSPMGSWLERLATARWKRDNPVVHIALTTALYGEKAAKRFHQTLMGLHRVSRRITESISLTYVREQLQRYASGTELSVDQRATLRWALAGKAAEDTVIHHPRFLEVMEREVAEVERLGRDSAFLAQHGLASLEPTPLLSTNVRTAGRTGSAEARLPFVDLVVLFRGKAVDGTDRYLVKVRGQVKLARVDQLVSEIAPTGELRVGQFVRDELRGGRGAWHFSYIRVEKHMLIADPRHTTLLSFGSRLLTEDEVMRQRIIDRIYVEHIVHDVPYDEFYRWADEFIRLLGIRVK